ncbi:pentapeptide repeat-containing protein [Rhodococcus sp. ABRD24]|uniref:pentapeptide repeat-containing protein n=1 Tax=Rhodococcus sp. ABRD24 TaxID=2507582 RepID=UPI00103EDEEA|nr:pentapeptide repeat-containing protein [Rhodococcus sp. ABRD24]QBJ95430.1 pentapeptide repeat-containing protein [Rhodococcus sp. ABRD24]
MDLMTVDVEQIVGEDFSNACIAQQSWSRRHYTVCSFRDADLSELRTEFVVFTECDFTGADLTDSHHFGSAFRSCTFARTTLWHSSFRSSSLLGSTFSDCRLRPLVVDEVDFTLVSLGGADLRGLDFTDCRFREANLVETDMRKAILRSVDLTGARVGGLRLEGADLRGAHVDPGLWTSAKLDKTQVELTQAVAYANATGLVVEPY